MAPISLEFQKTCLQNTLLKLSDMWERFHYRIDNSLVLDEVWIACNYDAQTFEVAPRQPGSTADGDRRKTV